MSFYILKLFYVCGFLGICGVILCLGSPLNVMPNSIRVIVTLDCYNVYLKPVLLEHYCIVLQFLHVGIPRARETVADQ